MTESVTIPNFVLMALVGVMLLFAIALAYLVGRADADYRNKPSTYVSNWGAVYALVLLCLVLGAVFTVAGIGVGFYEGVTR